LWAKIGIGKSLKGHNIWALWVVIVIGYPIINFGLSAFNYRIIHIRRISLTPNPHPHPHPHTIGFGLSTTAWISKTLLQIRIIRIRIGSDAEIIHTTFVPSFIHMKLVSPLTSQVVYHVIKICIHGSPFIAHKISTEDGLSGFLGESRFKCAPLYILVCFLAFFWNYTRILRFQAFWINVKRDLILLTSGCGRRGSGDTQAPPHFQRSRVLNRSCANLADRFVAEKSIVC
jgi:hypothetical protein